jgi:hypothetical protein
MRSKAALVLGVCVCVIGCDEEKPAAEKPAASVKAPAQPAPKATTPVASAKPEPKHDCPADSSGEGSFAKPCEAKGTARLMELEWNGKMTDKGPPFRVKNIAKLDIVYGKMAAYFYDKDGKQLSLKDDSGKETPLKWCFGKIFEGPMKVDEKAVITFSCVKKEDVPEGTVAIEAEMQTVGFTEDGKSVDFYWRNKELTPDTRPKATKKKK